MSLSDTRFSDLVLPPDGQYFLKGAGNGSELIACSDDTHEEARALRDLAKQKHSVTGKVTFRLEHEGRSYRGAVLPGVHGNTFFLRRLPAGILPFEELGLPAALSDWLAASERSKGFVLFSGAQASGKTTSASSLVAARLKAFGGHAVTFENPVEMPLNGQHGEHGFCFQSEVEDEAGLASAIEQAHRFASPDIIYIGEIRTMHAASQVLRAALGSDRQLVVATIHGLDLVAALDRLLTFARELDGEVAAHNLSQSLLAVVHQHLSTENGEPHLTTPRFLMVPFEERSNGVRAKLRNGELLSLKNDMREQCNRLTFGGLT